MAVYVQSAENKTTTLWLQADTTLFSSPKKQDVDDIFHDISCWFCYVLIIYDDHGVHAACDEFD